MFVRCQKLLMCTYIYVKRSECFIYQDIGMFDMLRLRNVSRCQKFLVCTYVLTTERLRVDAAQKRLLQVGKEDVQTSKPIPEESKKSPPMDYN